jgi:hypothetical protein
MRRDVTARLTELQRKTGWPRKALINEAARRAIRFTVRQEWLPGEEEELRELAGRMPVAAIARRMARTEKAVARRIERLGLARRPEGYTMAELIIGLGAEKRFGTIMERAGAFGRNRRRGGRIPEAVVARFLARHPETYDLAKVNQAWFKALMFGRPAARKG